MDGVWVVKHNNKQFVSNQFRYQQICKQWKRNVCKHWQNSVTAHTTFYNNSDSKLKDNQQTADHAVIQHVFDSIDVKTYERNDLNNEKRIGSIADDFFDALPEEFSTIVSEHTYQKPVEDGEPIPPPETIKQLDYSRLVCILWGALKNTKTIKWIRK